jgi:transcription initiation factor IIE alpha subunit
MKRTAILLISFFIVTASAIAQTKPAPVDTAKHVTLYTCTMHPDVQSHEPGKCPKCDMDLTLSSKEKMKASVTKHYTCPVHETVTSHDPGKCPQCGRKMNLSPKEQMKAEVMKTYTCPMHPQVALDKDGKCPKCGKELVEKKQSL